MTRFSILIFISFLALFELIMIYDLIKWKKIKFFLIQFFLICLFMIILHYTTGFPKSRISFGNSTPLYVLVILLISILLGMISNYFFYQENFKLRDFLRPFLISPIILLPLIGTIQGTKVEIIQLISISILAYQNGFFWKSIMDKISRN